MDGDANVMTRPIRPTDPNALKMKGWLNPIWYDVAYSVNALLQAEGIRLTHFQWDIARVLAARLPQTAPVWALKRFEQEMGLPVEPDISEEDRRARIEARFLGIGSTMYQLKQIANAWRAGDIAVLPDFERWDIFVQFISQYGIPADLEGHRAELRNNVQAHIWLEFLFHWTLWNEVGYLACNGTGLLWCQAKVAPMTWDEIKVTPWQNLPCQLDCTPESLDPNNPLYVPPGTATWDGAYSAGGSWQGTYDTGMSWDTLFSSQNSDLPTS